MVCADNVIWMSGDGVPLLMCGEIELKRSDMHMIRSNRMEWRMKAIDFIRQNKYYSFRLLGLRLERLERAYNLCLCTFWHLYHSTSQIVIVIKTSA